MLDQQPEAANKYSLRRTGRHLEIDEAQCGREASRGPHELTDEVDPVRVVAQYELAPKLTPHSRNEAKKVGRLGFLTAVNSGHSL